MPPCRAREERRERFARRGDYGHYMGPAIERSMLIAGR